MRAAFNTTFDAYYGYESPFGPPGVAYSVNQPCRVVPQTEISQQDFPLSFTDKWLTVDAFNLNGPKYRSLTFGQWWANVWTADMVASPSGSPPAFSVMREEFMHGPDQGPYWRYALLPLPALVPAGWLPQDAPIDPLYGLSCCDAHQTPIGVANSFGIGPNMSHWYRFTAAPFTLHSVVIAGTAGATFRTDVFSGVCPGLLPHQGPYFGNGAFQWLEFFGGLLFIRVQSTVPDSYTMTVTSP